MSDVPMQEILVLQQIREAIGDPHGKLMQDEVVEVIKKLAADAERYRWLKNKPWGWSIEHHHDGWATTYGRNELDAAIDKARGKP